MAIKTNLSARKKRILQGLSHFSTFVLVGAAFLIIYLTVSPFERGFYCTDETIRYPYRPDTIPLWAAGAYGVISAIFVITFTEFYLYPPCCTTDRKKSVTTRFILTAVRGIFIYALGAISTLLVTEIGKHTIGRLRPHFISVCKPDWTRINCFTKQNEGFLPNYIPLEEAYCTGNEKIIKEARLSFPSGHSSFSAYSMIFIIIYLEARLVLKHMHYVKTVFQLIAFIAAFHTAMSRVSDFKHHNTDVIAGATIGTCIAIFMTTVTGKILWEHDDFKSIVNEEENIENGVEFEERPDAYNL